MGTLLLNCPLCCGEKFTSHHSLKYHILSMIDNLFCPACNKRFESLLDLAEHLGRECEDSVEPPENFSIKRIKQETNFSDNEVKTKTEERDIQELPDEQNENTTYLCQICNVQFTSVAVHLAEYHAGEEVILEESLTEQIHEEFEEDEGCADEDRMEFEQRNDCEMDNFDAGEETGPLTEKYIMDEGEVKKITEEQAEHYDHSSIIVVHKCPKCLLQFPEIDHYYKHKCDPKKVKPKFKCVHCTAVFVSYHELTDHMKSHLVKDASGKVKRVITLGPYICDICSTMFPSFKSLRLHKRMHEPVKEKTPETPVTYTISGPKEGGTEIVRDMFICTICNKTYDKEYEEIHMESHREIENHTCMVCNRKFYTKENLEMHARAHAQTKKFACTYCKKQFKTYETLKEHIDTQCQRRGYECQYCGRRFAKPHEKVKHERIHTGEKPHACPICGKAFRVSYCLTLHMRTHSGSRPYQCVHCGKRFKSHGNYNHHLLTHSEVRAYQCPYCTKAFKTSVQLAGHKNSHTKPFPCTECNRPFASLYAVRAHMNSHKGENNLKFDCWLCGATYARAYALKDHMKSQHGNDENVDANVLTELEAAESADQIEAEMGGEQIEGETTQ